MPKSKKIDRETAWFTIEEMCHAFDVTRQAFSSQIRPLLHDSDIRDAGKKGVLIKCRAAINAWAERQAQKVAKPTDPLLVGAGDSPALEEYRKHRARLAEMDVQEREKTHANLAHLNDCLMRFSSSIRRGIEVTQRKFGPEIAEIMNSAIDQAVSDWNAAT